MLRDIEVWSGECSDWGEHREGAAPDPGPGLWKQGVSVGPQAKRTPGRKWGGRAGFQAGEQSWERIQGSTLVPILSNLLVCTLTPSWKHPPLCVSPSPAYRVLASISKKPFSPFSILYRPFSVICDGERNGGFSQNIASLNPTLHKSTQMRLSFSEKNEIEIYL